MLELSFSSKLDWGSYMISIAKTISKKNWSLGSFYQVLFSWGCSMQGHGSFHRWPCMKNCCHVWGSAPSCYLKTLDKRQKRICWTVGLSVAAPLEPLAHPQDVASISLFHRYYFGRHSSEPAQLVSLTYSQWRSTCYSDRSHDFSVSIPRCYNDVYVNSVFPCKVRPWNFLPIAFSPLTYDLNGFKRIINSNLLPAASF